MIISSIRHWKEESHAYAPIIQEALQYLSSTDFSAMECGKYPIRGEQFFVLIQEMATEPKELRRPESHERFIDIQYLLSGEENYGVSLQTGREEIAENLLETRDVVFYGSVSDEMDITLQAGMFAIFFPADIHRPCCSVHADQKIRKAVVKIDKELLLVRG